MSLTLNLIDPCESDNTVSLTQPGSWPSSIWITDSVTFAVVPATHLSHVTSPTGADCGAYTVEYSLSNSASVAANSAYYNDLTAYEITVDFLDTKSQVDTWTLTVTAYHTNYPSGSSASFEFEFDAEDPCADSTATTITLNEDAIDLAWITSVSIYTPEEYVFNPVWATSTTTGPTGTVNCGEFEYTYTLTNGGSAYITDNLDGSADVDF